VVNKEPPKVFLIILCVYFSIFLLKSQAFLRRLEASIALPCRAALALAPEPQYFFPVLPYL